MVTKRDIRELAQFECEGNDCALTFYFQPQTPRNKSHREEAILAKDLVRQALRESDKHGGSTVIKADLQRILDVAERLHGNQARAKAIFACGAKQFWREFDLPAVVRNLFQWARRQSQLKVIPAVERELIIAALKETRGNQVQAARLLGITRATLRKRVEKFDIKQELSIK